MPTLLLEAGEARQELGLSPKHSALSNSHKFKASFPVNREGAAQMQQLLWWEAGHCPGRPRCEPGDPAGPLPAQGAV